MILTYSITSEIQSSTTKPHAIGIVGFLDELPAMSLNTWHPVYHNTDSITPSPSVKQAPCRQQSCNGLMDRGNLLAHVRSDVAYSPLAIPHSLSLWEWACPQATINREADTALQDGIDTWNWVAPLPYYQSSYSWYPSGGEYIVTAQHITNECLCVM